MWTATTTTTTLAAEKGCPFRIFVNSVVKLLYNIYILYELYVYI